ncbi:VOC family protein [Halogeometricum borinquense]|uniref:VOC family protein n=1 Tax=Halogeometricum borinquense TaxID=60847 RepID=A0A6C0UMJ4_9EURY|nr:VOC family protein [Halogeometricum borinquense]QIQ76969.1 VOC family protein [Halogeometricum borinquense]
MTTGGILFFRTTNRETTTAFYTDTVGAEMWLEQPGCTILRHGNMLFGFCDGEETETDGIVTFVYDTADEVDEMYERVGDTAREAPHENEQYDIYQFFATDPDGRTVEFQTFRHEVSAPL